VSKNNDFMSQLGELGKDKEELKKKAYTIEDVTKDEPQEVDFAAIAAELEQQEEEVPGLNDGFVKTTLYLEENVFKAFQRLTTGRGEKKKAANEAISDWVLKEYNRRKSNK
jgi:hypothetical protein